jgi:hypothetical protein
MTTPAVALPETKPARTSPDRVSYEQALAQLESWMQRAAEALAAANTARRASTRARSLQRVHTAARALAGISNQALGAEHPTEPT